MSAMLPDMLFLHLSKPTHDFDGCGRIIQYLMLGIAIMRCNTVENLHRRSQALERADKEGYNSPRVHSSPVSPLSFVRVKTETLNAFSRSFRQGVIKSW